MEKSSVNSLLDLLSKSYQSKPRTVEPEGAQEQFRQFAISDDATDESAGAAWASILRHVDTYVSWGPFRHTPARKQRSQLEALDKAIKQVLFAHATLSFEAESRLHLALSPPKGLFGLGRVAKETNALFDSLPPDNLVKFAQVLADLRTLRPIIERSYDFHAKTGRPENWPAHTFLRSAISEWNKACGQPPTGSQKEGLAIAPLLRSLRVLVNANTEDQEVRDAISDEIYLKALESFKLYPASNFWDFMTGAQQPPKRRRIKGKTR